MKELGEHVNGEGNFAIKIRKNESTENLIRRFIKRTKKEKIVEECLDRKRFKKNTTLRHEALYRRLSVLRKLRNKERLEMQTDD